MKKNKKEITENDFLVENESKMYGSKALRDLNSSKRLLGSLNLMKESEKERIRYIFNFYQKPENQNRAFHGINGKTLLDLMSYVSLIAREEVKKEMRTGDFE